MTSLDLIYGLRSSALHEGTPFPMPMLEPPPSTDFEAPSEKPFGLASSAGGGTWLAADTPMTLATFEYVARGALLNWYRFQAGVGRRSTAYSPRATRARRVVSSAPCLNRRQSSADQSNESTIRLKASVYASTDSALVITADVSLRVQDAVPHARWCLGVIDRG